MGKFDPIWHDLKPKAIRLREEGLTPQQTCTELAWTEFQDKEKFNTVKGWYKRTFLDWPSEQDTTSLNARRPRQIGIPYGPYEQQRQAFYNPKTTPPLLPPQYQQNYPQNHIVQQGSISSSSQQPRSFPYQANYQNLQLQDAASYASFQHDFRQYPAFGLLQHTPSAAPHGMSGQGGPQNHPNTIASQNSTEHFDSLFRQHSPRDQYESVSQLLARVIEQRPQEDYTQYHQHCHSQHAQQAPEGGLPARRDSSPEPGGPYDRQTHQKSLSFEKSLPGYQLPLGSGTFETPMNSDYLVCMDNNDGGVHLPVDGQQFTMQGAVVPEQFVLRSEGRGFNTQPPNHQIVSDSGAGSSAISPSKIYQAFASPSHQYPNDAVSLQSERFHTSAKHYRSNSVFSDPAPPSKSLLPLVLQPGFGVIHKGPDHPWQPIRVDGDSMVTVNPNEFPTDHRRKRPRGKIGKRETRDSIAIYQEQHLEGAHAISPGNPAYYVSQASAARNPLVNQLVNSSNVSVRSSLRDSGYISNFDSAMVESIRSSLSSFTLADDPILNTDYKEDDDGNVEVEFKGKCRVRRSYIEKRDSSIVIMDDNGSSCLRSESAAIKSAEASRND